MSSVLCRRRLADNIKLYLREIWRQDVDGFVWFTYGPLMSFCEQGNELHVLTNSVEFVDRLSSFDPCNLVTLVKAVLLPEDDRQEVLAGTLRLKSRLCKIQKFSWYVVLHTKRCVPVTKTIRVMLCCEVVAVGYNISTWCRRNVSCWMLKLSVRVLTIVVQIFKSLDILTRLLLYTAASLTEGPVGLRMCDSRPCSPSCQNLSSSVMLLRLCGVCDTLLIEVSKL